MPRTTKVDLAAENVRLRIELATRDRSRSRRRAAARVEVDATPSASRRALDIVCKHTQDGVVEEQRATIARQAKEIADLRVGKGPIGPILAESVRRHQSLFDRAMQRTESVADWLRRQSQAASSLSATLNWGGFD